jgi:predicted PurR-regulated permease PerM
VDGLIGQRLRILLGIIGIVAGLWFIYAVRGILAPFILAFILAYVMTPLVDRMEGRGLRRTASILLIFAGGFLCITLGVVTAGKRLAQEMVDLSVEFLREESTEREFVIRNGGSSRPMIVELEAVGAGLGISENPFAITEPRIDEQIIIEPGSEQTVRIRFSPSQLASFAGNLKIREERTGKITYKIPLRGNSEADDGWIQFWNVKRSQERGWRSPDFWDLDRNKENDWGDMGFSISGLDFGSAGPNVLTKITILAKDIEPHIQPIIGQDTDLATLIQTHGSRLINVLLGRTTELVGGLFSGIMLIVIVPFVAFFFLREGRRITHGMIEMVPNGYFEMTLNLLHSINNSIGGYIRGQILAVSVVAILAGVGLMLIGMPYAWPIGVLAGLSNMIPYLGPIIGIAAATVVALATLGGMSMVTKVVIVFAIIQIVDNVLIQPIVIAKSVDLHPLVILVVVMIGSDLWGIVGMLVAVPATGILKVSTQTIYNGIRGYSVS